MRRRTPLVQIKVVGLVAAIVGSASGSPIAVFAQQPFHQPSDTACGVESEPNELPEQAPSLVGEICLTGTLPPQEPADQDLALWDVLPEDGMTTWRFTLRGVPTTITSVHVIPVTSPPGVFPLEVTSDFVRVDSDAHLDTPAGVVETRIPPGRYLLGISRGAPFEHPLTDDIAYELRLVRTGTLPPTGDVEPNDDPTTASAVAGAFTVSGDLVASEDRYSWSLGAQEADVPQRIEATTAVGAPLSLELTTASGELIASASADSQGVATLHDLGLPAGDYDIRLSPAAAQTQPYTLAAAAVVDADVDPEPNDTPERALALDPSTLAASGRLSTDLDVDIHTFDVDAALATNLIDIEMSWSEGLDRTLCLSTESGTRMGCLQGDGIISFDGLLLPAGRYRLEVSGWGSLDDRYHLSVAPGAPLPPTGDVEPNDDAATASPVMGAFAVSGDLAGSNPGSGDVFAWTVSEADAARSWSLELSATPGIGGQLWLYGSDGEALASASTGPEGTARIYDLHLPTGLYTAWVTQSGSASPNYVLRSVEETAADIDPEPNDTTVHAVPMDPTTRSARGRIETAADVDRYSFVVDEALAANLVDVALRWPSERQYELCLDTENGSAIQCRDARDGVSLGDLHLDPGRYELRISGEADPGSRYDVTVTRGIVPAPDHEAEPNDVPAAPTDWDPSLVMRGRSEDGDVDVYRVHVEGAPEVWRLEATGTGLASPLWTQPDGTRVGVASVAEDGSSAQLVDLYLVAGDHLLTVGAAGEYSLTLTSLGPPDLAAEREPNDDVDHAAPLGIGGERSARLPVAEDVDVYRFSLSASEHVVVTVTPPADGTIGLEVTSGGTSLAQVAPAEASQPVVFDGPLPQGDFEIWLRPETPSAGIYSVRLDRADPFLVGAAGEGPPLAATLFLTSTVSEVAAHWREGQAVDATLQVTATGDRDLSIRLDGATSHHAWSVELPSGIIDVPAGGMIDIPLTIEVPADAWLEPVSVTVRVRDENGAQGTAFIVITPSRDAPPVDPRQAWSVPDDLLGGLDVASEAIGGQPVGSHFHEADIHDGVSIAGLGLGDSIQNGPLTIGVDLAGDGLVPVAGTILDPLTGDPFAFRPRAFALLLSEDGETFREVLSAELGPQTENQAFVLDEPVPARFARLRIDSTWGDTPGQVSLGEWKVVAAPGYSPTESGFNIADPLRGGHVVWSDPGWWYVVFEGLSDKDTNLRALSLEAGKAATWVIGFGDDRAGQITGLEWDDPVGTIPEYHFSGADVAVSLDSPFGPWQEVGEWRLQRADDGTVAAFELPEPTWARFVRLTLSGSGDANGLSELPGVIRVIERATDDTYRSILGEWGQSSPEGIYELLVPRARVEGASDVDVADSPEHAAPLAAGEEAAGRVARGRDVDWYALTVPEGQNTLRIELSTEHRDDVHLRLVDESGHEASLQPGMTAVAGVSTLTAIVEPAATYRLEVTQPVLSVVVTFDTSASIAKWLPQLRAAVRTFADDVTPGQEVVQIFPFEEPDLLESWSDQPFLISGGMDAWTSPQGSSAMEASIRRAADGLLEREGTHAILVLGDAVGGGFEPIGGLPAATLELVRPVIFPVHLGGADDPYFSTHIMQDLAATNGGFYQYATSQAAIERAFERMATWLRRPADYGLSYETSFVDYPPGSLAVAPAEGTSVPLGGGVSVELVLDTSGSMNKKLEGVTRMAVAQTVLTRLVGETLPEGLPVALRTFKAGNGSCKTVMASPFGPLDRATMGHVINGLRINRKTRTPLGVTLHAVGDDLADRPGPKIVVFVTDGKETCKGDPEAEVVRLDELGVEVALNIVGFALDDPVLKADMESWATAGGGVFFDAQDQQTLLDGIAAALRAPFRVYDLDGTQVASGVVGGEALELPAGTYRLEVLTDPLATFDEVVVSPAAGLVIEIEPAAP